MGTDKMSVVDPNTRVQGMMNLRVVDSSIFPTIPNGNLNAPTIMVAERAADLIKMAANKNHTLLPASDAAVGMEQDWQTKQRDQSPNRIIGSQ